MSNELLALRSIEDQLKVLWHEAITGVNLPATQLQIAMGIPLYNVPDIRRFYGMDPSDCTKIDFFKVDYPPITSAGPRCAVLRKKKLGRGRFVDMHISDYIYDIMI